jgi:hypothetical protein
MNPGTQRGVLQEYNGALPLPQKSMLERRENLLQQLPAADRFARSPGEFAESLQVTEWTLFLRS